MIRQSALELASEFTVEAISVEAICEKAGISQRTFFNYFPYKEAAFVLPPPPFPEEAVEAFLTADGDLLELLSELLAAQALAWVPDKGMVDIARRAALGHPKIAALQFASFREFEEVVAGFIASRYGENELKLEYRIIAAGVLGALRVVVDDNAHSSRKQLATAIRQDLRSLAALSFIQPKAPKRRVSRTKHRDAERVGK